MDHKRLYAAGMSGGARVVLDVALNSNLMAGVIANAAKDSAERRMPRRIHRILRGLTMGAPGNE